MSALHPLTDPELFDRAPTLFTEEPHHEVSDQYHFIPTIDVIHAIKEHNWYPVTVQEANVRDVDKEGYQRHLVRFRHFDDLLNPPANAVELLLFNSHDRTTAFSISAGIYRFVCANGLVIAESVFESYKIKHIGERANDVTMAIENIMQFKPLLHEKIHAFEPPPSYPALTTSINIHFIDRRGDKCTKRAVWYEIYFTKSKKSVKCT